MEKFHDVGSFLSQYGLSNGSRVRVNWKDQTLNGLIIPQSKVGDVLTLKLDSGYNVGLRLVHIRDVEKIGEAIPCESVPNPRIEEKHHSSTRPGFVLIGVGGTIASKVNYETGGVIARMTPDELSGMVPEINDFSHIVRIRSPFTKMSEDLLPEDWISIAKICHEELNKSDVEGIILTHGTDTLHYTAAALSFMLQDVSKPIVLVGSQRSSDRGSSDAVMNLVCAARVAISDIAEVGICMHGTTSDDYCLFNKGTHVRKMHTTRRDAFRPINRVPIARVWSDGKIEKLSPHVHRTSKPVVLDAVFEEKVALVKMHPGLTPDVFHFYADKGYKGVVIEATGLGHVHTTRIIPVVKALTEKGIFVFITSQTIYGRVDLNVYTNLRLLQNAGAIGLGDMTTETAFVKLGWVLAHTQDRKKVIERMTQSIVGEITEYSDPSTFLY
ncbi:MAG: Glu-tRNA(Gln) amidotransferase subunit GatD [Candidatus Diapherotrites archaeon]